MRLLVTTLAAHRIRSTIDLNHNRGMNGLVGTCQAPTVRVGTTCQPPTGVVEIIQPLTGRGHSLMSTLHRCPQCNMWTTRNSLLDLQITLSSHQCTHQLFHPHKVRVSEGVGPMSWSFGSLACYTAPMLYAGWMSVSGLCTLGCMFGMV